MHDLSDWQVVVVDDEPENIGVAEFVLKFHDIEVCSVASGEECLDLIDAIPTPTLLLIDIQMPHMSGYELKDKIKDETSWAHLPMIAVTAHALEYHKDKILDAGFDGYIAKPINVMTFIKEITTIMNAQEG